MRGKLGNHGIVVFLKINGESEMISKIDHKSTGDVGFVSGQCNISFSREQQRGHKGPYGINSATISKS